MTRSIILGMALVLVAGTLTGCEDLKKALGMVKSPPDEFTVVQSAPLVLPPDYGLRPPHTPSGKELDLTPTQQARVSVFRLQNKPTTVTGSDGNALTAGEQALLAKAAVPDADPHIREKLDADSQKSTDADNGFVDSLLIWKGQPTEVTVEPGKEAQRLREDQVMGKPVTAGDTPSITRTSRSLLSGLL